MTETEINQIIAARERLTNRRDEQVDWVAVNHFDAVLSTVPPGQDNRIDLLLGRDAELPERVEYFIPDPDSPREILARRQRSEMDDEMLLANWPLCAAACQIRRERMATDTAAATEAVAELAQAKQSDHDAYLESIADQYADMLDWHRLCGDLAI